MKQVKKFKWSIMTVIIHLVVVLYFSTIIDHEAQIPRQWNLSGEVGSYSSRGFGLWFMWGLSAFLVAFFALFSYIDPRYFKHKERFDAILPSLTLLMASFMALLHIFSLLWAIDVQIIQRQNTVFILIGILFILLGNILPKIPSNFFAGFRSPWTLSSDTNWHKTHRLGGYVFVVAGCLMIVRGFFLVDNSLVSSILLTVLIVLCFYPFVYSYMLFRKERKERKNNEHSDNGGKDETH
jgi:uncharacterized membrane protein